uniref:Protein E7 n=1 Tax=Human papillomavirus TaxID=10566 RepID=A0A385PJJ5_9PAPI|nr:MAG: E7 protein [Human papillomavirus]
MIGEVATLKDIELNLESLVLPANLLCDEEVNSEEALEVDPSIPYRVETYCNSCEARLKLHVVATAVGIRHLQTLLLGHIALLCPGCSRTILQDGRR